MNVAELKAEVFDLIREAENCQARINAEQQKIREIQERINEITPQIDELEDEEE